MRVCVGKSTGKLIESQSGGETHPNPEINNKEYAQTNLNVLLQNAINAGYKKDEVEVKFVTDAEYQVILEASIPEPTKEQLYQTAIKVKGKEILRRQAIAELEAEKEEVI